MNTTQSEIPTTPATNDGGHFLFGIFVRVPFGMNTAACMVAPLRRLFIAALRPMLIQHLSTVPLADGVLFVAHVTRGNEARQSIFNELQALGYLAIAHVGAKGEEGWHCLHGSADTVAAFDQMAIDCATTLNFETQVTQAHFAAAIRKPEL